MHLAGLGVKKLLIIKILNKKRQQKFVISHLLNILFH